MEKRKISYHFTKALVLLYVGKHSLFQTEKKENNERARRNMMLPTDYSTSHQHRSKVFSNIYITHYCNTSSKLHSILIDVVSYDATVVVKR